jgi:hypothetical protein
MSTPILGYPFSLKMARSPIFITGKNNTLALDTLTEMDLNLRIRTGVLAASGAFDYALSKNYSIDEVINFEISDLIRDQFLHDFTIYDSTGYVDSPTGEALWVVPTGDWTYSDNGTAPELAVWSTNAAYAFLCTDGWSSVINNTEITSANLAVSRERFVLANQYGLLALNNLSTIDEIEIVWNNGDADIFYYTASDSTIPAAGGLSTKSVIYAGVYPQNLEDNPHLDNIIKPSAHDSGDYYDVVVKDSSGTTLFTQRFTLTCEPKYTPLQLSFINRFGMLDYLTFFKRSDERGNFTKDSYQKSIYNDAFTSPLTEIGKYTDFNVNSRNTLTLNTGFVGEDHDNVIEDILMSERVCLLLDGDWVAVVPDRGSVEYQKQVNTRLINYTMTFNKGFDERSLVR